MNSVIWPFPIVTPVAFIESGIRATSVFSNRDVAPESAITRTTSRTSAGMVRSAKNNLAEEKLSQPSSGHSMTNVAGGYAAALLGCA